MSDETKKIRTLIVDDEPLARRTLRDLLASDTDVEVVGECKNGPEAVSFLRRQPPDLLFLDIQMPGMNGFEVLAQLEAEQLPAVVFVTAFDQYALRAFEVHALDYLLKPFSDRRFEEALRQAKTSVGLRKINRLSQSLLALLAGQAGGETPAAKRVGYQTRFMIRSGGRVTFVEAADVDWIAADDYYVKLHAGGKSHLLRVSMNELEERLDPQRFLRIHRSTIVNSERVKELHQNPSGEYVVVLKGGAELKLSRSRRERVEQLLTNGYE
ncbi:MAG TPA: LytTR family DNA-binding domain-containing protein [Pyrinomonadaceae bacterium]|nr:LytTR family DNA-binding domain-containing protein [Pyrinomonadaceae bacterium]